MICRIWHGWTRRENADAYEQLSRKDDDGLVAFVTMMWFDSIEAVQAFAGPAYQSAVVPPAAQALLLRYDREAVHYEVRERAPRG